MRCCDAGKRCLLLATYVLLRAETLFRPYNGANVGGHASYRDTCHLCTTYVLLRRWEASPPTCHLCAVATLGSVASYMLPQMVRCVVRCLANT